MKTINNFNKWVKSFKGTGGNRIKLSLNPDIELWEEDFLVKKIQSQYSAISEESIREAVKSCYLVFRSPQSGEKLVQCVINKLKDS